MTPRIKICGITRPEDGLAAAEAGADAIGLMFHPASSRAVTTTQAAAIVRALPPLVTVVAVVVDASRERLEEILSTVPVHVLQVHGDESPEACARWGRPWVRALRMREDLDVPREIERWSAAGAAAVLLDTFVPGQPGGTGARFDWRRVPRRPARPVILAGGLTPENVGAAVCTTGAAAVDVSGGVESAPGVKDAERMRAFVRAVHGPDERRGIHEH